MSTDLVAMNVAELAKLQSMAKEQELDGGGPRIPIIKINYDHESKFERGDWLIGQEKDKDGNITNEGRRVTEFVVIDVFNRYNLFNQKNKEENCCSPLHNRGDKVRGNKHGYVCGKTCPKRDKATLGQNACKAQLVPFGLAITEDGEAINARFFVQGDTYMPFSEYLEKARNYEAEGRQWTLPTYAFSTKLSSEKKKNEGTTYFVGKFERGNIFNMGQIEKFAAQIAKIQDVVDELNEGLKKGKDGSTSESTPAFSPSPAPTAATPTFGDGVIDVTPHSKSMSTSMDDMPTSFSAPKVEVKATAADASLDFNIEDAISKALGGSM